MRVEKKGSRTIDYKRRIKRITTTSKRQVTIPKSFFEILMLKEGSQFDAYLDNEKIMLVPVKKEETVYEVDRDTIIKNTINEGYTGDKLAQELSQRLEEYDNFINNRVKEFENDIEEEEIDGSGDDGFNGLELFFNKETGENVEKTGEKG